MINIKTIFRKNNEVFFFSLLKYFEIGLLSFLIFFLAKKIGPKEMGYAIPFFLFFTYSNYISLGLNQVVVKNYERNKEKNMTVIFMKCNLYQLFFSILLTYSFSFIFFDKHYLLAGFISSFNLIKGFFSAYYRAVNRVYILNISNVFFAIILSFFVFFFVSTWSDYMKLWSLSSLFAIIIYLMFDYLFFIKLLRNGIKGISTQYVIDNFKEGVKLAFTGLVFTLFLTFDKLVINQLDINISLKGSYQLADQVGMALYLFLTTIIFYFYPKWINNIRKNISFRNKFLRKIKFFFGTSPLLLLLIYLLSSLFLPYLFPKYENLVSLTFFTCSLKFYVVILSLISMLYIGKDKELVFLKKILPFLLISLIALIIFIYLIRLDMISIISCFIIIVVSAILTFFLITEDNE